MGRIQIEIAGGNDDVFWIRRFHDQKATRLEYPQGFCNQSSQLIERDVLNNMKSRNDRLALIRQRR